MNTFCQSCGMPMKKDPGNGGTNADGSRSPDSCSFYFGNGAFTSPEIKTGADRCLPMRSRVDDIVSE